MAKLSSVAKDIRTAGGPLKQARAQATRDIVIAVARKLFSELGYHESGIAEIVARADVTRGSLYYHFVEKRDLFEAVFLQVLEESSRAITAAVEPLSGDRWQHFLEALFEELRNAASDRAFQQIVLIDGPAVLGWPRWSELRTRHGIEAIAAELEVMMDAGIVRKLDKRMAAQLVMAALNEAALAITNCGDAAEALDGAMAALGALVNGLRV